MHTSEKTHSIDRCLYAVLGLGLLSFLLVLLGFTGQLWGKPQPYWAFCVGGFLSSVATFALCVHRIVRSSLDRFPDGISSDWKLLKRSRRVFQVAIILLFALTLACLAIARTSRGVADEQPVFAPRETYILHRHGERIPVTKLKYEVIGVAESATWSLGQVAFLGIAAYYVCFGKSPFSPKRSNDENLDEEKAERTNKRLA